MTNELTWLATFSTVAILVCYELALAVAQRRAPGRLARTAHASLRQEWFEAVSTQKNSEILAVQTLRNSLMSATMTASTAALGLIATATLAAPSLRSIGEATGVPDFTPRLAIELMLLALLFSSLVSSAMAVRYYNHAGFIGSMPIDSEARRRWQRAGSAYVRRAGVLYSWGLRHLILVAPVLASILHPATGPVAALVVVAVMFGFDRIANPC